MRLKEAWQETCKFIRMMQASEPHLILYLFLTALITASVPFITLYFSARILNLLMISQFEPAMNNVFWMIGLSGLLTLISKALNQRFIKIRDISEYKIRQRVIEKSYQIEYEDLEKTETLDEIRKADQGSNGGGGTGEQLRDLLQFLTMFFSMLFSLLFVALLLVQIFLSAQD